MAGPDPDIISSADYGKIIAQQNTSQIAIDDMLSRIQSKKANMDERDENVQRMVTLNTSYRDKQQAYLVLMTIFLFVFGLCLVVVFMQQRMGYDSGIMDWLLIAIITIGLISAFFVWSNIISRDSIYFSKLDSRALLSPSEVKGAYIEEKEKGDLTAMAVETCTDAACCGPGFEFNNNRNKCEPQQ